MIIHTKINIILYSNLLIRIYQYFFYHGTEPYDINPKPEQYIIPKK